MTIYRFDPASRFVERIATPSGQLGSNSWVFEDAIIHHRRSDRQIVEAYKLPTSLSPEDIENSFSSIETKSFWELQDLFMI